MYGNWNFTSFYQHFEYRSIKFLYKNLSSYLAENRVRVCYKNRQEHLVQKVIAIYCETLTKIVNMFSGKLRVLATAAGGMCDYHWTV